MDQLAQETQTQVQMSQQTSSLSLLLVVVLVVAVVLVAVVLIQNRRIKEMQTPKYGFLGKPLNAFILMAVLLGGVGFAYVNTNFINNEITDVSADSQLSGSIIITQVDSSNRVYQFNVLPTIDGLEWGGTSIYSFEVQWTISNGESYYTIERNLTNQTPGGIRLTLEEGIYSVKATIIIDGKNSEIIYAPGLEVN